jgi:hypothetical protein
MSVPMIGPGPLEGGPKGSPGPATNADEFSACLKEECNRESAPAGGPLPPKNTVSAKSELPAKPEQTNQSSPKNSSEQSVEPVAVTEVPGLVPLETVSVPSVPNPLVVKETPDLMVLLPESVDPSMAVDLESFPVEDGLPAIPVEGGTGEEDSDTDDPSLAKESFVPAPPVSVSSPLPLVVAEVPLAVIVPDRVEPNSNEGLIVESPENSGAVEAVSRTGRELDSGIVAPVIENPKAKVGPTSSLESDQPAVPPAAVKTPDLSLPKAETDRPEGTQGTLDAARPPLPSNAPVNGSSENGELPAVAKVERPIQQKSGPLTSVQSTMPAPDRKAPSTNQDATFRDALKAVSDTTSSFKSSAEVVLTGEGVVSTPRIEKGAPVEPVRPAVPVPVLSPSPMELAKQIHVHLESGRSVVHVELHPEHLGEMNIALEAKGKDVSMRFTVENDSARHSVVAGLKELSGSLNTLGWTVNGLAVQVASGGVGNGRSDADGSRWSAFPVNANQVPVETKTDTRPASTGVWRVDLVA